MAQLKNLTVLGPSNFIGNASTYGNGKAFKVGNETYSAGLLMGSDGKSRGLYDFTLDKWMIYANENGAIQIDGTATDAVNAVSATKWTDKTSITIADSDATNTASTGIEIDGTETTTQVLKLPATIKATLTGTADKAQALVVNSTTGVGSATLPVYFDKDGTPKSCNTSLAVNITGKANTAGTADMATAAAKLNNTSAIGGTKKFVYFSNQGVPVATTETVGGSTKPIYMNAGTITAFTSTLGSSTKPIYMNAGSLTACSYDVNVANTTESGEKLYLIGAASSNAANQTTYGKSTLYADEFGALHSTSFTINQKVNVKYNTTDECLEFVFA